VPSNYSEPIPLIRSGIVAEIADVLDVHGASADPMLEHARIPLSVREERSGFVPGHCVWTFAAEIYERGGPRDFLFGMASASEWRRSAWVPRWPPKESNR
jgi:hypothetical protein